jgi:hypothetical protein
MLTTNSSAICRFEVGTACGAANGPASAISTRHCAGVSPSSAARRPVLVSRVGDDSSPCVLPDGRFVSISPQGPVDDRRTKGTAE